MRKTFSPATVLILALSALLLPIAAIEWYVLRHTHGTFMYPLDDTFIHMALARNLAFHGVWGMNPYAFASASSSVLYTLLLATLFKLFSVHVLIPFVINGIVAIGVLVVVRRWLEKEGVSGAGQLVILLGLIFLTPLPILVICGMEHTLQCLFCFLFIYGFSGWLEKATTSTTGSWKLPWPLFVYGMLVTFVRYEGLFLIAIACVILWYHRKLALAVRLGFISVLPLVVFGVYSVAKGSYFLPNSVLLKSEGAPLNIGGMLHYVNSLLVDKLTVVKTDSLPVGSPRPGISLLATQRLLLLLPLSFLVFWKYIRQRVAYGYILGMLLVVTVIHLCFAATGWLYRYEAYLIFCSAVIVGLLVWQYGREVLNGKGTIVRWMMAVVVFAVVFPLVLRSAAAFSRTGDACVNIYQQQYQMGQFLRTYYDGDVNAVNDIGAVSFFTRGANIDLWGLGNIQVARSRKSGRWNPGFLDSLCRAQGAGTAVFYEKWFNDSMRNRWTKVATWRIGNNVICGDDSVSFFAIRAVDAPVLKGNLQAFEKQLPAGVEVKYY